MDKSNFKKSGVHQMKTSMHKTIKSFTGPFDYTYCENSNKLTTFYQLWDLWFYFSYNFLMLNQNTPSVKKEWPRPKKLLIAEIEMGGQSFWYTFVEVLIMMTSCYFRHSRLPDVDGIKVFGEDDQAAYICFL